MNKKQYFVLLILIVLIIGSAFYWFEYRKSKIISDCWNTAKNNETSFTLSRVLRMEVRYQNCLREKGVEYKNDITKYNENDNSNNNINY